MTVWAEVQEALYQRWAAAWVVGAEPRTPYAFANEGFDPPEAEWARFSVRRMPGGQGTLGRKGNRKMDRVGMVFIQLREPPGLGVSNISDLASEAARIFEGCRFEPHDIRFAEVEPGDAGEIDNGRWWGLTVEGRFDYQEII